MQKALQEKITDVIMALTNAYQDMSTAAELPTLGKDKARTCTCVRTVLAVTTDKFQSIRVFVQPFSKMLR